MQPNLQRSASMRSLNTRNYQHNEPVYQTQSIYESHQVSHPGQHQHGHHQGHHQPQHHQQQQHHHQQQQQQQQHPIYGHIPRN